MVVFEYTIWNYSHILGEMPFILIAIGILFILYKTRSDAKKFIIFMAVVFFLIMVYSAYSFYGENKEVRKNLEKKSYKIAEGVIENLHVMPKNGQDSESFDVNGSHFKIVYTGDYPSAKTLFYTLTKNRNGPIQRNGQRVKIYYIEDELTTICIPFTGRCITFNENQKNKIIKMWVCEE